MQKENATKDTPMIPWTGGVCPVNPQLEVEIQWSCYKDGYLKRSRAGSVNWSNPNLVSYRVLSSGALGDGVTYIRLYTGDNALVVNRTLVETADAEFTEPDLQPLATKLAAALGEPLKIVLHREDLDCEWTWPTLLASLDLIPAEEKRG